jgi:MSHA biogenesis protein MshN
MSLINQVLKDLEKRHATRADVRGLPPSVRPLPEQGSRRAGWLAAAAGLLILATTAAAAWWFFLAPTPPAPGPAPARQPIAQPPPSPISQPAAGTQPSPGAAPAAAPASAPAQIASTPAQQATGSPAGAAQPGPAQPSGEQHPAGVAAAPALQPADPATAASKPPPPKVAAATVPAPRKPEAARSEPIDDALADEKPAAKPPEPAGSIDKQIRPLSSAARSESEFRRGMSLLQQGRAQEAEAAWRSALEADPSHEQALQALLGALLERGRRDEAEALLQMGLQANPRQVSLAMLLARLQLDRGAQQEALDTLLAGLPNAQWNPDYLAMTAAVLARASRHHEAAALYQAALRIGPNNAVWTMGLGLALRADGQPQEARAAFERARDLKSLNPDLQAYVEGQIRELK